MIYFDSISQNVDFIEYDLDNGLHVILHQDKSVPLAVTSVMYHVGSKDDSPDRTGFAHFFEHLLFEGTENIDRGQFMKIVESNGGSLNAYTSNDETYYFEFFPSNKLELGLWLESERMLHPVIDEIGVQTQNEVVKEEKRSNYENRPYGQLLPQITQSLFKKHPYRWLPIGSMEHLDAATLEEFIAYNKKFYVPNNAVLVVAGNFEVDDVKKKINDYFGPIPRGEEVPRINIIEDPITAEINNITGKSCLDLLIFSKKECSSRIFGMSFLLIKDQMITYDIKINAIMIPGTIPAINNFAIDSCTATP